MTGIEVMYEVSLSVVAFATLALTWKTKTLTDVVQEMKVQTSEVIRQNKILTDQTKVLAERLNLEIDLSHKQRYPTLIIKNYENTDQYRATIDLYNIGTYATSFAVESITGDISISPGNIKYSQLGNDLNKSLQIILTKTSATGIQLFTFTLKYQDGYGKMYFQNVRYVSPQISISPIILSEFGY